MCTPCMIMHYIPKIQSFCLSLSSSLLPAPAIAIELEDIHGHKRSFTSGLQVAFSADRGTGNFLALFPF